MLRRTGEGVWVLVLVLVFLAATGILRATSGAEADVGALRRGFERPPDDARIMMRWWWFGPSVTRDRLDRELRLMKEGGIGGVEVQPVYPLALDDEKSGIKNLPFLSPGFLDALGFAAARAKELGLRFDLTLGSGWPYGGPMFPIAEAAGRLRYHAVPVADGARLVPTPPLREGDRLFAAFVGPVADAPPGAGGYREVEIRDGAAVLPVEIDRARQPQVQVLFLVAGHTGMKVKRPAVGAEGYVIDHYDPRVIAKFLETVAEPALRACGENRPYSVFCDSLEVDGEDWTGDFLDAFRSRRGYDLRPHLPALVNDVGEATRGLRHDWGKTLTELFDERFLDVFERWSRERGTRFRIQGYGTPPAALHSFAHADLNEGEGHTWKGFREARWASSASHLLGRPVTSSETWTWLHSPVFRATPLDMKAEADLHFLQGINQLIGHGWPYTPQGVDPPGWRFYASAVFDEQNPWWLVMPDVARYLRRVSHLLRQGHPANDVALYLANDDAWSRFAPGRVSMNAAVSQCLGRDIIRRVIESGYNLDFFDDELLARRGSVDGGTLAFGDVHYKVVVLAGVERMPAETLRTLEAFARGGGVVVATRRLPARAPGFKATEADHDAVKALARRLFEGPDAPGLFLPSEDQFGTALSHRLRPDMSCSPEAPEIGSVHRRTDEGDLYLVANTGNARRELKATFRISGSNSRPEWWDPLSGRVDPAEVVDRPDGGTTVALDLEPYGTRFLVFHDRAPGAAPAASTPASATTQALDLGRDWTVSFGEDRPPTRMDSLRSWTVDEATRHFSGVATYEKTVEVPGAMLREGVSLELDLGPIKALSEPANRRLPSFQALLEAPVREAAVVSVNGRRAGSAWCPPYSVDLTGLLHPGENRLTIEVANLALNRMAASPLPDYRALNARYGERFQAQDMDQVRPIPSGLLGPIRIIARPKR